MSSMEISRLYKVKIKVLSPLHVGSGDFEEREGIDGKAGEGGNERPLVATIIRDATGRPYIPATTLKGLLRRLVVKPDEADLLFGTIKDSDAGTGTMGVAQIRGARLTTFGRADDLPYSAKAKVKIGEGLFVAARTAINDGTGAVDDGKLFFQEMVAPGSAFAFEILVAPRKPGDISSACAALEQALAALALPSGQQMGKGQADGFGRVRLVDRETSWTSQFFDTASGALSLARPAAVKLGDAGIAARKAWTVTFRCDGPFLIADASRKKEHKPGADDSDRRNDPQIRPQRVGENLPLVLGSSLSGALRDRAEWLAEVQKIGAGETLLETADGKHLPTHPVQRLFGVTGFRGLMGLRSLDVKSATPWKITSVKLDRFSGAPVDNALFTTETFIGVEFTARFEIEQRGYPKTGRDAAVDEAARSRLDTLADQLLHALRQDLKTNGLQIGAGGNKGFGWFTADIVEG